MSAVPTAQWTHSLEAADGARLAYHIVGEAPPSVVLVHGWMTSGRVWDRVLGAIATRGALVVDLRGAGQSSRGAAAVSLERLVLDLRAVVEHAGLDRFHLVGHSMGGQLALLLAAGLPGRVRSLALLNPVPLAGLPLPAEVAGNFRNAGGRQDAFDAILNAACKELTPEARALLMQEALAITPQVIAEGFDAWTTGTEDGAQAGPPVPTMVLATDDPFLPPALLSQAVVAHIPGAVLEHLPGPGHYPQLERPGATAERLCALWGRA